MCNPLEVVSSYTMPLKHQLPCYILSAIHTQMLSLQEIGVTIVCVDAVHCGKR